MVVYRKLAVDSSVYDLALDRIRNAYARFDRIAVSFSGGKDSTAALQCTIAVARELGKLPVDAFFWDEEAIFRGTIDYVDRVRSGGEVRLRWLCVPIVHRNACSRKSPYWVPWDPELEHLWVRSPPEGSERSLPGLTTPLSVPELNRYLFDPALGSVGIITGIRAAESLRRYRSVAQRVIDNWLSIDPRAPWCSLLKPIYDWTTDDVWTAPKTFGWDYNTDYDAMERLGLSRHEQRVCPPFGEEPLRSLWTYGQMQPDLWERMLARVPGARTAARYSRSPLYSFGESSGHLEGETNEEAVRRALAKWPPRERAKIAARIKTEMKRWHEQNGGTPIPEDAPPPGFSWKFILMVARRGDLKDRKRANTRAKK